MDNKIKKKKDFQKLTCVDFFRQGLVLAQKTIHRCCIIRVTLLYSRYYQTTRKVSAFNETVHTSLARQKFFRYNGNDPELSFTLHKYNKYIDRQNTNNNNVLDLICCFEIYYKKKLSKMSHLISFELMKNIGF